MKRKPYATIVALIVVAAYYFVNGQQNPLTAPTLVEPGQGSAEFRAFEDGAMVESQGVVEKTLPDDNEGSKHQRFILKLANGQTVLVAHNIDLAARINGLTRGDSVKFRGQYETNNRGGVVHWTHHDPRGEHPAGWLEHNGKRYH
jgi:hypothetical protein